MLKTMDKKLFIIIRSRVLFVWIYCWTVEAAVGASGRVALVTVAVVVSSSTSSNSN